MLQSTLDQWFLTPPGKAVAQAFVFKMQTLCSQVPLYGNILVQFGACGENAWLKPLRYDRQWIVSPISGEKTAKAVQVHSLLQLLPFEKASIDCVVCPLSLETFSCQEHPLDEIDRVLKPMGYIIFFGIHAMSLWGLALYCHLLPCFQASARPWSLYYLKHTLLHRGYSICYLAPFYYIPPVKHAIWIRRLEIFNELGKMISPYPGGFYGLVVQKYVKKSIISTSKIKDWQTMRGDLQLVR